MALRCFPSHHHRRTHHSVGGKNRATHLCSSNFVSDFSSDYHQAKFSAFDLLKSIFKAKILVKI